MATRRVKVGCKVLLRAHIQSSHVEEFRSTRRSMGDVALAGSANVKILVRNLRGTLAASGTKDRSDMFTLTPLFERCSKHRDGRHGDQLDKTLSSPACHAARHSPRRNFPLLVTGTWP